jgi:hypothetical protein
LIVSVLEPIGVDDAVHTVSAEEPAPTMGLGLNVAVAFVGNPATFRVTLLLKPLTKAETETV